MCHIRRDAQLRWCHSPIFRLHELCVFHGCEFGPRCPSRRKWQSCGRKSHELQFCGGSSLRWWWKGQKSRSCLQESLWESWDFPQIFRPRASTGQERWMIQKYLMDYYLYKLCFILHRPGPHPTEPTHPILTLAEEVSSPTKTSIQQEQKTTLRISMSPGSFQLPSPITTILKMSQGRMPGSKNKRCRFWKASSSQLLWFLARNSNVLWKRFMGRYGRNSLNCKLNLQHAKKPSTWWNFL